MTILVRGLTGMSNVKNNPNRDPDFEDFDDVVSDKKASSSSEKPQITYPAHEELIEQVSELEEKIARLQAEMENMRKRSHNEIDKTQKYALEKFAKELLPVFDTFERALEHETNSANDSSQSAASDVLRTGLELTLKLFQDALTKFGVKAINPLGHSFDPTLHEAMSMQESADKKPGTILAVLQKGYHLNDRLLRPALVMVAKAPEKS